MFLLAKCQHSCRNVECQACNVMYRTTFMSNIDGIKNMRSKMMWVGQRLERGRDRTEKERVIGAFCRRWGTFHWLVISRSNENYIVENDVDSNASQTEQSYSISYCMYVCFGINTRDITTQPSLNLRRLQNLYTHTDLVVRRLKRERKEKRLKNFRQSSLCKTKTPSIEKKWILCFIRFCGRNYLLTF